MKNMITLFRLEGAEPPAANCHQNTGKCKQIDNTDNWLRKAVYYIFEFISREH